MSVSGQFREYCILTSPFLWVWLEEVSTLGGSEHEDSLNKQEKDYNLYLYTPQSAGGQQTAINSFGAHTAHSPWPPKQERREREATAHRQR